MGGQLDVWLKWFGLLTSVIAAFWAYTKLILEKGLLPPSEFTVDCTLVGEQSGHRFWRSSSASRISAPPR